MVLLLVTGCWLGWFVNRAHIQRRAIAAIEQSGGRVSYDWQWKNGQSIPNDSPGWPKWLVECIGLDYFGSVVGVELREQGSDSTLILVGGLNRLEKLYISRSSVTDAGLAHLKALAGLKKLVVYDTPISDAGLVHLNSSFPD
jgi:hypothetical protein